MLDVAADRVGSLVDAAEGLGLRARPGTFRRGTMACTGIEFCKLAIIETKARASKIIDELERRLPDFDEPLTINVNGCPNSCARVQVADIGLKGMLVLDADGKQVEGFQVHLGGGLGLDAGFGRKLRGHKITADELPGITWSGSCGGSPTSAGRASASRNGSPGPTRRRSDEVPTRSLAALAIPRGPQ